jgi:bifunctional enzyme CysN/CysC
MLLKADPGHAEPVRDLLRLTTAGSVDDGKSTLIGRLLTDLGALARDQLDALKDQAKRDGTGAIDLARITDGLSSEREQGITIDVAYRYFATPRRSFILADVPGHEQYTRNMATGASKATAALFLVDARSGMTSQTRRHVCIAALLGIRDVVFAVNKMDLVDWREDIFAARRAEIVAFSDTLGFTTRHIVPVSAKLGDNVVRPTDTMPWYGARAGEDTLIAALERLPASRLSAEGPFRMAVQLALRPQGADTHDFRGFMGRIARGRIAVGDRVRIYPGDGEATVTGLHTPSVPVAVATAGRSVTLTLDRELDAGRGALLADPASPPGTARQVTAALCWLDGGAQNPRLTYRLRIGTRTVAARIAPPDHRIDVDTLARNADGRPLAVNDIGTARISLAEEIAFDSYGDCRATGSFIVIDPRNNATVAAGMIDHGL